MLYFFSFQFIQVVFIFTYNSIYTIYMLYILYYFELYLIFYFVSYYIIVSSIAKKCF